VSAGLITTVERFTREDADVDAARCLATGDDGGDHLVGCAHTLSAFGHRFLGGRSDDVVEARPADDAIDGGGGRDVLHRGGGNDYVDDGDGATGGSAPDVIDGGSRALM
jgi:Ca2+-binding RTX toxin-like protein